MEVKNLAWNKNISERCNHSLLPLGIRGLIIGKSGCGKTTSLINLLLRPGWLGYNNINIFGKRLFQPEYHNLNKAFEEKLPKEVVIRLFENQNEIMDLSISPISIVEEMAKEIRNKYDVECTFCQSAEDVPYPRELSSEKKKLMVFDDLLLEKLNNCELCRHYVRGRYIKVDYFNLAQNNFKLPRQTIREKATCLFPKTRRTLTTFSRIMWVVI